MNELRYEIYKSSKALDANRDIWYWRLRARNGRIIADSGEGYSTRQAVTRAVARVIRDAQTPIIIEVDEHPT